MNHIEARKQDILNYQVNIDNYTQIIKLIPPDLPERLVSHAATAIEQLVDILPFEDIQQISDYQFRKKIATTLVSERLEQRKSQFVLEAMLAQQKE